MFPLLTTNHLDLTLPPLYTHSTPTLYPIIYSPLMPNPLYSNIYTPPPHLTTSFTTIHITRHTEHLQSSIGSRPPRCWNLHDLQESREQQLSTQETEQRLGVYRENCIYDEEKRWRNRWRRFCWKCSRYVKRLMRQLYN